MEPFISYYAPKSVRTNKVAVVLLNHVFSTARHTKFTRGDTVGDQRHLADSLAIPVFACDRPGSGPVLPNRALRKQLDANGKTPYKTLADNLSDQLAGRGIHRIIIAGRSAGGLGALQLAQSINYHFIPTEVVAMEPVGIENLGVKNGQVAYNAYNKTEEAAYAESGNVYIPAPDNDQTSLYDYSRRAMTIARSFFVDKYHNQQQWARPTSRLAALAIAESQPATRLSLLFAEHSLVAQDETILQISKELTAAREEFDLHSKYALTEPVVVEQIKNTWHRSFNNRDLVSELLAPSIEYQADMANSL